MSKLKAILIDSVNRSITEIDIENSLESIYIAGGYDCVDIVYLENNDAVYVDDEGLLNKPQHFFILAGYKQPIAGNGVILGTTDDGDNQDIQSSLDEIKNSVRFVSLAEIRQMITNGEIDA